MPGVCANPGGRPRSLGRQIRDKTRDGRELVDFAVGLVRDRRASTKVRLDAAQFLAAYGWGRPVPHAEASEPRRLLVIAPGAALPDELADMMPQLRDAHLPPTLPGTGEDPELPIFPVEQGRSRRLERSRDEPNAR
jgi:hypothetical protein